MKAKEDSHKEKQTKIEGQWKEATAYYKGEIERHIAEKGLLEEKNKGDIENVKT